MPDNKIHKSNEETIEGMFEQLDIIKSLCEVYDQGNKNISKSIATHIRLLCHHNNKGNSKSLIHQAKLNHINFLNTSPQYDSKLTGRHLGLISVGLCSNAVIGEPLPPEGLKTWVVFNPKLGECIDKMNFEDWWENNKVLSDARNKTYTRRTLVREVANTDGGAHFDAALGEDYFNLIKKNAIGITFTSSSGQTYDMENPVPGCIRQIAHELLITFDSIDIKTESKLQLY